MKFRWLAARLLLLSGLAWGQAASHGGPDAGAAASTPEAQRGERERLVQARAAQQARWAEREQACGQLFWVNSCLRQAKLEHRRAMSDIERQQTRLESDIRQRRASEVAQRMHSRAQDSTDRPTEREQRQIGADEPGVPAGQAQPKPVQPQEQADQQLAQRQEQREKQASERLLKQEQRQEQASARTQRREQSAQAAQAAQAARLERYAQRAAASDEAPP